MYGRHNKELYPGYALAPLRILDPGAKNWNQAARMIMVDAPSTFLYASCKQVLVLRRWVIDFVFKSYMPNAASLFPPAIRLNPS